MSHILPILLLLSAVYSPVAHAARSHGHSHLIVAASSLKPSAICSELKVIPSSNRTWFPLHHLRGPCSRVHSTENTASTAEDVLRQDQLRADVIHNKTGGPSSNVTSPTRLPTFLGTSLKTLLYVVTVGLGTPAVPQTLLIDSGSDLSWVQCRPCPVPAPCHAQKDAFYDPAKSSTYSNFSYCSAACARLGANTTNGCSSKALCQYTVTYGDNSSTKGTYSSDTLTLQASSSAEVVRDFKFGCSHADTGFVSRTDGIMGLGGGTESLVSQAGKRAFSYCLPPTASQMGFLALGAPRVSSSRFSATRMYRLSRAPTFHIVLLEAITVAGRPLAVPASAFAAGSIMDSGTIITRLPPTAYDALRAAFRAEMKAYSPARPKSILDTCFNLTGIAHVKLPRVALVFHGGAALELHPAGILQYGCLAFASTGDDKAMGIIGNVQQRTFEVLYDVGGGAVGFRRGAC